MVKRIGTVNAEMSVNSSHIYLFNHLLIWNGTGSMADSSDRWCGKCGKSVKAKKDMVASAFSWLFVDAISSLFGYQYPTGYVETAFVCPTCGSGTEKLAPDVVKAETKKES